MKRLRVEIPGRGYDVHIGEGLLGRAADLIELPEGAEACALVADASACALHGPTVRAGLRGLGARVEEFIVPAGESSKSIESLGALWRWMASVELHRSDVVIALGGGVVGDLAGFAAATINRGVAWVQMPTTLLAMVDASIGGKTAIDIPEGKNLVGAFHQPRAVIADTSTLQTLSDSQFATGLAEVVKHGLISTGDLHGWLRDNAAPVVARDPATLEELVAGAAAVKVEIVGEDETERGRRAFLNYGHTLAHALEALGSYAALSHGEAVAIGMMFAANLAPRLGYADRIAEHRSVLERFGLPTGGAGAPLADVLAVMRRDKKYESGLRFVVLEDLGRPALVRDVPPDAIERAYEAVR